MGELAMTQWTQLCQHLTAPRWPHQLVDSARSRVTDFNSKARPLVRSWSWIHRSLKLAKALWIQRCPPPTAPRWLRHHRAPRTRVDTTEALVKHLRQSRGALEFEMIPRIRSNSR